MIGKYGWSCWILRESVGMVANGWIVSFFRAKNGRWRLSVNPNIWRKTRQPIKKWINHGIKS